MDLVNLTRELISIHSYLDKGAGIDEVEIAKYIESYLRNLRYLQVKRQAVEGERYNVIAHDGKPARLVFCCHMDTVQPSGIWNHDMFAGHIVEDNLYGLGAADMKGGLACVLDA